MRKTASGPTLATRTFGQSTLAKLSSTGTVGVAAQLPGVSLDSLFKFVFPTRLENPDTVGRLELFAYFGPTDDDGFLRGGPGGAHRHTDHEISQMASDTCLEACFEAFGDKPRSLVDITVRSIHRVAMKQRYDKRTMRDILDGLAVDSNGRMNFTEVQKVIIASQKRRLVEFRHRAEAGLPIEAPKENAPRVGFQSKSAKELMELTRKKKMNIKEEDVAHGKRLNSYGTLCGTLEQQNLGGALRANVLLMRSLGDVDDRWDRYCAVRRIGRSSYVKAKNESRINLAMDEGLSNKHPHTSSLIAATAHGSSAAVQLAA